MAALDNIRRSTGEGISEAVNRLVRAGLTRPASTESYQHRASDIGLKVNVHNVGEVLALLDEASS